MYREHIFQAISNTFISYLKLLLYTTRTYARLNQDGCTIVSDNIPQQEATVMHKCYYCKAPHSNMFYLSVQHAWACIACYVEHHIANKTPVRA